MTMERVLLGVMNYELPVVCMVFVKFGSQTTNHEPRNHTMASNRGSREISFFRVWRHLETV